MAFSFFMRDQQVLEVAAEHLIRFAAGRSKIRVWDAGCARGQETWSLAMILAERMNQYGFRNLKIDATDHDSQNHFGAVVTQGTYSSRELERTPRHLVDRYFQTQHDGERDVCQVIELLRQKVTFQYHDLLSLRPVGGNYCLILCKNVLLHLQYEDRVAVFRMFHKALTPGGYLATEQTQKLPPEVAHLFEKTVPDAQLFKRVEHCSSVTGRLN